MFPIDPSFHEKKVLPQRGSRKYWFSSASYATIEPRGQKRPKPDCGIATLMKSLTTISTIIVRSGQSPIAGLQRHICEGRVCYTRLSVRSGQSPIAGLQQARSYPASCCSWRSEAAKARLRDCNRSVSPHFVHTFACQKRPKPDCGIATSLRSSALKPDHSVRSGQSPIAGLQRTGSAYKGYLAVLSEAAKARLRDCNSCDCCEGDVYAVSEAAKARLRDCNRDAVRHGHSNHCVRSGQSPIAGLQRAWVAPAPDTLTSSEAAKARLRDCNPPGPRDRERINVRSGQSPIAGLQHMEGEAQPRSSTKSEAAKARLRDCNPA